MVAPRRSRVPATLFALFLASPGILPGQDTPDPLAEGLQRMERAAGGRVEASRSSMTGRVTFLTTQGGRGIPAPDVLASTPESRALSFLASYGRVFGLTDTSQLRWVRTNAKDPVGMDHVRFQQAHDGVPVTGAELIVHIRGARVTAVNARTLPDLEGFDTAPRIDAAQAARDAHDVLAKHLGVTDATLSEPRLEILSRGLIGGPPAPTRLAWFIEATRIDVREFIWVDARQGGAFLHFSQLTDARSRKIYTAANTAALPGTLVRSEGGPPTGDPDVNAAYDFSGDTYNYYSNEHGRDSYDGAGAVLKSTVHYCPSSSQCPYQNAFWNGTQMVYGEDFSLADDVDAHELTHAVTEKEANLFYYMQSGALNESFSDIFGESVDLTNGAGNDTPGVRWQMGEDVPGLGAIRNMMDPTLFGDPGKMSDFEFFCGSSQFADRGGVHTNSGVPNHAYALMVDGGTYNGSTVSGIGLTKAGKIQYRALTQYLISSSDFLDNYNAVNRSCSDLVGTAGITAADCTEVQKAMDAVEMTAVWGGPTTPCSPTQPTPPALCTVGQGPVNVFFDDLENITSGKWTTATLSGGNHWVGCSGSPNIYCPDFATSGKYEFWGYGYAARGNSTVNMSRSYLVPAGALMKFSHSFGFESSYDGGVLEYSTNNGSTWLDAGGLISAGASYNGTISTCCSNPLANRPAFVRESWGYTATQLDLSSLAGQNLRFRFRIGTDSSVSDIGWFIDDVRIYTCDVGGSVQFSSPGFSVSEAGPTATIMATRNGGAAEGVTVDYFTSDGTANADLDYRAVSGTLSFGSGVMSRTFTVPILNDTLDDDSETVNLALTNVAGPSATLGPQDAALLTIVDNDVPGTVQFSAASYTVAESGPVATITVARSGGAASGVTVEYTTSDGTATAGSDYTPTSGTLTFAAGQVSKAFTIPITNDTIREGNETVNLTLQNPGGGATLGARTTALLTIVDNDLAGTLRFSASTYSKSEGGGSASITVTRSSGAASGVTVDFATSDGTATAGSDYTASSGTLSFGASEFTKSFTIAIQEDSLGEDNETVKLTLSNPTGGATLSAPSTAVLTILENESVFQFSAPTYTVIEGIAAATITVKRTGTLTGVVSVDFATSDGSATTGSDYTQSSGTLSFASGVVARTFTVPITNDTAAEASETVLLRLSSPSGPGSSLGPRSTAVLTIKDNDSLLQFGSATYAVTETGPVATIMVKRTGFAGGTVGAAYATSDGTALAGSDYSTASGTLTFGPGVLAKTFTVPIANDTDAEGDETVNLTLSSPTGGAGLGTPSAAVLTIKDNDPRLQFGAATYTVTEVGPVATITVRRAGSTAGTVGVSYATSNGTALAGSDYSTASGDLTFGPGILAKTFTVPITNDTDGEGNETVNLALSTPTGGAGLGTPSAAVLTITDNEPLLRFSAASYSVGEAGPTATITVMRTGPTAPSVSVGYTTGDGTATAADYTTVAGTLTFGPGVVARTFTVPITNDTDPEGNETVNLTLSSPSVGAGLGIPSTAVLKILDNEPVLFFSAAAYTVAETGVKATITVRRAGSAAGSVGLSYTTADGTASAGSDYTTASGTLTFAPGVLAKTFTLPIANDTLDESSETVNLTLSSPTGGSALGTPSAAVLTITDNDTAGVVQFGAPSFSVNESGTTATIAVIRTGGTAGGATVDFATSDGTATALGDYTATSGILTFLAGETTKTFTIDIIDDGLLEGNETVNLTLSSPGGGATLGAQTAAVLYVVDDEAP